MQATVIREFKGVVDGDHRVRPFKVGEIIEGDLASAMVDAGYATDNSVVVEKKPRATRAKKGAPLNKAG